MLVIFEYHDYDRPGESDGQAPRASPPPRWAPNRMNRYPGDAAHFNTRGDPRIPFRTRREDPGVAVGKAWSDLMPIVLVKRWASPCCQQKHLTCSLFFYFLFFGMTGMRQIEDDPARKSDRCIHKRTLYSKVSLICKGRS